MNKQQLLNKLEQAWHDFNESYAGLSGPQLTEPGVTDGWSVKDIIAHVTTWEEEALEMLPLILGGGTPPRYKDRYGGLDAFNALRAEQKRRLTVAEVRAHLESTHRRLIGYIESVPEEQFTRETRFRRRLRLDTYSHYPIHARAIRAWRERRAEAR